MICFVSCVYAGTFGYNATTGTDDSGDNGLFTAMCAFCPDSDVTATTISVYTYSASGTTNIRAAIYTNNGYNVPDAAPVSLVSGSDTGAVAVSNGSYAWKDMTINASLTGNTTYWIAFNTDSANTHFIYNYVTSTAWQVSSAYSGFPPASAPASGLGGARYSAYVTYTTGGGGGSSSSAYPTNVLIFSRLDKSIVYL